MYLLCLLIFIDIPWLNLKHNSIEIYKIIIRKKYTCRILKKKYYAHAVNKILCTCKCK